MSQLFALLGLALRRSCPISAPGLDNELRAAYCRLRAALVQQLRSILESITQLHTDSAGASGELVQSHQRLLDLTVRTHVLRCYAQLLAGAAQQLRRQRSRRNAQAALEALTESMALLRALALTVSWAADGYAAVALEVTTSSMVEAWAGAYLELASSEACNSQELAKLLHAFGGLSPDAFTLPRPRRGKATQASPPALRCLLSLVAVQLAVMMDGGSLYGLSADAPEARCTFPAEAGNILARVATYAVEVLSGDDAPPVAVFDLSIRLARGAVVAWLTPPEGPSELQRARVGRARMSRSTCGLLAGAALMSALECLKLRRKKNWASGSRPADAARLRALWATLVAILEAAMREERAAAGGGAGLPACWAQAAENVVDVRPDRPFTGLVPAAPGVVAEAMLAAGLVACCERLLRQGHAWPCVIGPQEWLEVLSYGPLPDLTALLVTAAKALRRVPRGPHEHGRTLLHGSQLDADLFFDWAAGGGWSNGGAQLAPAGRAQQPTQAVLLWSLAAVQLLPAAALRVQRDTVRSLSDVGAFELACARLAEALRWCGVLMAACAAAHEWAGCADAAACAAAEAEAAQWRELLLRDVGLMRLMGAAASMLLGVLSCGGDLGGTELLSCFSSALGLACCALPQELRAALLEAEAEVAADALPRGITAPAARDDSPVFAPLSCEAVRAVLGPGGAAPDPDAMAEFERIMTREQWRPCFAGCASLRRLAPGVAAAGALLVPPAQVEALLAAHCCANPACSNLSGRSERALRRVACGGGCGLVRYCGEECRAAHWAAGHAGSCRGAAVGAWAEG